MPTLALCLKESMRLYPPVPFMERELAEETLIDGHAMPPGTQIAVSILFMHRHPMLWEDPDDFRPERFTWEQMKGRDTFSYVPFSAGPRNCIGQNFGVQEIKILICRIIRKYTVELAPVRPPPIRYPQVTLQSENGMWLKFKLRT
ncbi:cytochrome P450 4B1 [Elysia marginata]|uniref:Cytochrome P450 4B1 n=1 Tax=Elysia marginata TaxID=1093978 RepID=A0AAV4FRH9_9GAST|nr:cytochrome P450 4B1 [Elysia marginata]